MSGAQIHVRLFRDSFNTPWGFRLQGGKDISQLLTVQRVFSNSPAEGELQRGDVILQIGDKRAQDLTHKQAQDLIKFGGGQINLVIQRPPSGQVAPLTPRPHQVQAPTFRPQPQQPPMPAPGGQSYGFTPKKVTLSRLGGGGPSFGSDYTSVPVQRGYTPMSAVVQQEQQSPGGGHQMLNRVQESLDNIILSPRTPEPPYQSSAPFYQQPQPSHQPPTYQGYIPTSARIDMQQQQQNQQQQLQYSQGEDDYPIDPVWERRKLFMEKPTTKAGPPPTKGPKPRRVAGPAYPVKTPSFGVDYAAPKPRGHAQHTWQPGPPAAPPMAHAPPHIHPQGPAEGGSAPWRETLKTTGVKPWDKDLQYTAEPGPAPAPSMPRYQPPSGPGGSFQPPGPDEQDDGPKVVHLQYNSPMGLYSNQNIQETFQGQTKAMASQGAPVQQQQQGQPGKQGDRDWNQSSVYRMIKEQETRRTTTTSTSFSPSVPVGHQQQSYRRVPAPDDEVGISDF